MAGGLSVPHSPRWYQGKLWVLNSGEGKFGFIDMKTGQFKAVAFCPGYLRGMSFHGDLAVVGLSKPRENKTFEGLALQKKLEAKQVQPRCGLQVINIKTGDVVHELRIEGMVEELYDVCILPGVQRPMAIGFANEEIRRVLSLP